MKMRVFFNFSGLKLDRISKIVLEGVVSVVNHRGQNPLETNTWREPPARRSDAQALTTREASVLMMIVQGSSNKQTGEALGISPRTVEFHRGNIMRKVGAKNVAELVRIVVGGAINI